MQVIAQSEEETLPMCTRIDPEVESPFPSKQKVPFFRVDESLP